jgi:glutathione S-transferase
MRLFAMSFSPYSEKARWALDHHKVPYTLHEHVPLMGEVPLRLRSGQWRGRVSVPLAVDGDTVLRDSLAIAKHAERVGAGSRLFPDDAAVHAWDAKGDAALGAGRALLLARLLDDREALRASLPGWIPGWLRGAATPISASATRFLARKYDAGDAAHATARQKLRDVLGELRTALAGRPHLLDGFSYADVAMAVVLQMVSPVDDALIPLDAARRRAWTEPTLAREYADLVAWRDGLYVTRRR